MQHKHPPHHKILEPLLLAKVTFSCPDSTHPHLKIISEATKISTSPRKQKATSDFDLHLHPFQIASKQNDVFFPQQTYNPNPSPTHPPTHPVRQLQRLAVESKRRIESAGCAWHVVLNVTKEATLIEVKYLGFEPFFWWFQTTKGSDLLGLLKRDFVVAEFG